MYEGQGIDYTIGRGKGGEVFIPGPFNAQAKKRVDSFLRILNAVFTTQFREELTYNSGGSVIRSKIILSVDNTRVRLGGHFIFWWLRTGKTAKTYSYEPYYDRDNLSYIDNE